MNDSIQFIFIRLTIFALATSLSCSSCSDNEYETPKSIAKAIEKLPKEWFLLTEKNGRRILIEPYEGINPTFRFEYDPANERMQIRYQANLVQRVWVVQKLIKEKNTYIFLLLESTNNKMTRLTYSPTEHPAVGSWREPSAVFLPYKNTYFTWDKRKFESVEQDADELSKQWEKGEWLRMKGTIESKDYSLWAFLCVTANANSPQFQRGLYYYDTFWRDIYLENARNYKENHPLANEKFEWIIEEREAIDAETVSGYFKGSVDYEYNFEGIWESAKTNQNLKFSYREEILPYKIENHIKHFRTADGSLLCVYYPQISGVENEELLQDFNVNYIQSIVHAWQKEFLAKEDSIQKNSACDIEINYNIIFANKNLLSGLFYIRQGSKRTEYLAFNYDIRTNQVFRLHDLFDTKGSFEQRIQIRAKRHVEVESERHQTEFEPYDSLTVLEHYNFLPDNLRLTLYSHSQKKFFPIYIPYKDLRAYIKDRQREIYLRVD